jgi:uncharacterized phage-associated protein
MWKSNKGGVVNMSTLFEVAKNFLDREPNMSLKKLQKLCWYAYSWYIALNNEPDETNLTLLFEGYAEAWVHGPVFSDLYADYRHSNMSQINAAKDICDKEIISHLNEIWDVYGGYNGYELESLTHQELPWLNAREGLRPSQPSKNRINERDVFEEYLNRN